jgi:hypothetical protein
VEAAWRKAVRTRELYDVTYRLVGPGGERWLSLRGAPVIVDGEVREWIGIAVDVTETRLAAEVEHAMQMALVAERETLAQVVAQAPMAVAVLHGPEHRYALFNERYLELGPSDRVEAGLSVAECFPEAQVAIPLLDRAFAGETVKLDEFKVPFPGPGSYDGHRIYDAMYTPILEGDDPTGVLVTASEITEQVRRRDSLEHALVEERHLAMQLQAALLPIEMPVVPGAEFAVKYLPASTGIGVGGDWYDVVALDGGGVLLVMGDICGHGLQAATEMAQVRAAVRAYAIEDPRPEQVLTRLARFSTSLGLPDMITVGLGILDVVGKTMTYSSAGHLPPLLMRPGSQPGFAVHEGGPPLGSLNATYSAVEIAVPSGSFMVMYTDGVVEERDRPLDVTMEELRQAAVGDWESAADLCTALSEHPRTGNATLDDAAVLVCSL